VRPAIPNIDDLVHKTALRFAESVAKDFTPRTIHNHKKGGDIRGRALRAAAQARIIKHCLNLVCEAAAVLRPKLSLDVRP
jgi:hypothetical protein